MAPRQRVRDCIEQQSCRNSGIARLSVLRITFGSCSSLAFANALVLLFNDCAFSSTHETRGKERSICGPRAFRKPLLRHASPRRDRRKPSPKEGRELGVFQRSKSPHLSVRTFSRRPVIAPTFPTHLRERHRARRQPCLHQRRHSPERHGQFPPDL